MDRMDHRPCPPSPCSLAGRTVTDTDGARMLGVRGVSAGLSWRAHLGKDFRANIWGRYKSEAAWEGVPGRGNVKGTGHVPLSGAALGPVFREQSRQGGRSQKSRNCRASLALVRTQCSLVRREDARGF